MLAIGRLRTSKRFSAAHSSDELEDAWEDFLLQTEKVYQQLKAASRGDPKSSGWFGRIDQESADDELLNYVRHARDAEYHRFEEVAQYHPALTTMGGPGTGMTFIDEIVLEDGKPVKENWASFGERPGVRFEPPHLRPLPVTTRGVTYPVPTKHLDRPLQTQSVVEIAELTLAYLRAANRGVALPPLIFHRHIQLIHWVPLPLKCAQSL